VKFEYALDCEATREWHARQVRAAERAGREVDAQIFAAMFPEFDLRGGCGGPSSADPTSPNYVPEWADPEHWE